jgi:hypothetical protein
LTNIRATTAVDLLAHNLSTLPHPNAGAVRLPHPGKVDELEDGSALVNMLPYPSRQAGEKLRRIVAEALVHLLEGNGYYICNGASEAAQVAADNGYIVSTAATPSPDTIGA